MTGFKTLLLEVVKEPGVYRDWKERLKRDPQGRATNEALDAAEMEKLFREHAVVLEERAIDAGIAMWRELLGPAVQRGGHPGNTPELGMFREAETLAAEDSRFQKLPRHMREQTWRRAIDDMLFERDHPREAAERAARQRRERERDRSGFGAGLSGSGAPGTGPKSARRGRDEADGAADGDVVDKAYQRMYIDVDKKRVRRD